MDRVRSAFFVPLIILPIVAIAAVGIGMFLHLVEDITCDEACMQAHSAHQAVSPAAEFGTPFVALVLVVIITVAGLLISGMRTKEPA